MNTNITSSTTPAEETAPVTTPAEETAPVTTPAEEFRREIDGLAETYNNMMVVGDDPEEAAKVYELIVQKINEFNAHEETRVLDECWASGNPVKEAAKRLVIPALSARSVRDGHNIPCVSIVDTTRNISLHKLNKHRINTMVKGCREWLSELVPYANLAFARAVDIDLGNNGNLGDFRCPVKARERGIAVKLTEDGNVSTQQLTNLLSSLFLQVSDDLKPTKRDVKYILYAMTSKVKDRETGHIRLKSAGGAQFEFLLLNVMNRIMSGKAYDHDYPRKAEKKVSKGGPVVVKPAEEKKN